MRWKMPNSHILVSNNFRLPMSSEPPSAPNLLVAMRDFTARGTSESRLRNFVTPRVRPELTLANSSIASPLPGRRFPMDEMGRFATIFSPMHAMSQRTRKSSVELFTRKPCRFGERMSRSCQTHLLPYFLPARPDEQACGRATARRMLAQELTDADVFCSAPPGR